MNSRIYLKMLAVLLFINVSGLQAAEALPLIERQVVKISAVAGNGVLISIPRAALVVRNGIPGVFVVSNNQARFRMVRRGKIRRAKVEILSGLFGDESLIIGELKNVHDGSPVKILKKLSGKK